LHFLGLLRLLQICTADLSTTPLAQPCLDAEIALLGRCASPQLIQFLLHMPVRYLEPKKRTLIEGWEQVQIQTVGPVVCIGVKACSPPEGCMLSSQVHQCHRSWVLGCQDEAGGRVVRSAERAATQADSFSNAALVRSIQGGTLSQHQM